MSCLLASSRSGTLSTCHPQTRDSCQARVQHATAGCESLLTGAIYSGVSTNISVAPAMTGTRIGHTGRQKACLRKMALGVTIRAGGKARGVDEVSNDPDDGNKSVLHDRSVERMKHRGVDLSAFTF